MTAPPRRRFRYTLRTLFIAVTVVCLLLGYHVHWIRQRNDFFARNEATLKLRLGASSGSEPATAPGLLWLIGEVGRTQMNLYVECARPKSLAELPKCLTTADVQYLREARRLFPEADFYVTGGDHERGWEAPAPKL